MPRNKITTPFLVSRTASPGKAVPSPAPKLRSILVVGVDTSSISSEVCSTFGIVIENKGPITAQLLSQVLPDTVVLPLMSAQSDALADIKTLSQLGYVGRCVVLIPKLPNREMVLAELRLQANGQRICLLDETRCKARNPG